MRRPNHRHGTGPVGCHGAAMVEFAIVAPVLTLLGLMVLQWVLVANARQQVDHATFMAARAGSTGQANVERMQAAYARNLIPLYGGGLNSQDLALAHQRASRDVTQFSHLRVLNPTRESFDDWSDDALTLRYGQRAIPNSQLPFRPTDVVGPRSGQTLHDANLLKVWVVHGHPLNVPLAGPLILQVLRWTDPGDDPGYTALLASGRLPLNSHVVLHMQSDALEPAWTASAPAGSGHHETGPQGPGAPQAPTPPMPNCLTAGCTVIVAPWPGQTGQGPALLECPPGSADCGPLCANPAAPS